MKPVALIVSILLVLIAVAHLVRLVFGMEIVIAGMVVPMWISPIACVVMTVLAVLLWRESRR
jgi:membrane protein implicated in regulation of membrane protease activity